ncbi:hypothetical protein [Hafnia paralvei]|uniref:hypothetical protein n=1 Tax=Hafnia paralvei TaxID=546367 RepID=UPI0038CFD01F
MAGFFNLTQPFQWKSKIMEMQRKKVQEPLFDENNVCVGTIISVRHVNIITPTSLLTGKINQHAVFQAPSDLFTEK